jgi:hypothetical protein
MNQGFPRAESVGEVHALAGDGGLRDAPVLAEAAPSVSFAALGVYAKHTDALHPRGGVRLSLIEKFLKKWWSQGESNP